jgi:CRP-like cAMP-binding protein
MDELKTLLQTHHPEHGFGDKEIEVLTAIASRLTCAPEQLLFQQDGAGDTIYLVAVGAIDIFALLQGRLEQTLMTVRTVGFIGLTHLVDEPLQEVAARAAEVSVLYAIKHQELIDLISGHLVLDTCTPRSQPARSTVLSTRFPRRAGGFRHYPPVWRYAPGSVAHMLRHSGQAISHEATSMKNETVLL